MFSNTNLYLRFYFDDGRRIWIAVGVKGELVRAIVIVYIAIGCVFGDSVFQGKIGVIEQMKRL
jgi:hypothetical protein